MVYLELLSSLVRANSYNCFILKRMGLDEFLFHCFMTIIRRPNFQFKEALINLMIPLLQFLWSQSMTVHQLDQCFKLLLTNRSLLAPLLCLFKHLVHQIDSNQPRSYCSMPLSSFRTSKSETYSRLSLDELAALRYPIEDQNKVRCPNIRKLSFATETLKNVIFQYPLTLSIWIRVNYPFNKHENQQDLPTETELNNGSSDLCLHLVTLYHETVQYQFWIDPAPKLLLKIFPKPTFREDRGY